jgi:hypothetical protein
MSLDVHRGVYGEEDREDAQASRAQLQRGHHMNIWAKK